MEKYENIYHVPELYTNHTFSIKKKSLLIS